MDLLGIDSTLLSNIDFIDAALCAVAAKYLLAGSVECLRGYDRGLYRCTCDYMILRVIWQPPEFQFANSLRFLYEFRFQLHRPDTIDLAVDIMIAIDQADIFDLCTDLDY